MMKSVDKEILIDMEPPVLYSEFKPCVFGNLMVKYDSASDKKDIFALSLNDAIKHEDTGEFSNHCFVMHKSDESIPIDLDVCQRQYLWDDGEDQQYAVWEHEDIKELKELLSEIEYNLEDNDGN